MNPEPQCFPERLVMTLSASAPCLGSGAGSMCAAAAAASRASARASCSSASSRRTRQLRRLHLLVLGQQPLLVLLHISQRTYVG